MLNPEYRESAESRSSSQEGDDLAEPSLVEKFTVSLSPSDNDAIIETPVYQWDVNKVANWVRHIPFPESQRYASMFIEAAVHGPLLLQLNTELLEDIGVKRKVHIRRFLTDIEILKRQIQNPSADTQNFSHTDGSMYTNNNNNNFFLDNLLPLINNTEQLIQNQTKLMENVNQLQERFETMPYWNRVRMVEKLGLADTESISRHFEDLEDGAFYYPSIFVDCEKCDHIIIGHYTCFGKLYGKPFYVKNCKTKKLLLYYRSDLDKKRWRFTRTNKHSLADFCEKRKYQARTKDSCDFPAAHLIPFDVEWAVWDGRTDHAWRVTIEISDHQPFLRHWVRTTDYGLYLTPHLCDLCASFIFVPPDELYSNRRVDEATE